jgi:hypothetical protein
MKAAPTGQAVDLQTITRNTQTYAEELWFLDLAHGTSGVRHDSNELGKNNINEMGGLIV